MNPSSWYHKFQILLGEFKIKRFVIFININKHKIRIYLPAQVVPLPEYPALQSHSNDPGLLVHKAFASHGDVDAAHLSIFLVINN